MHLTESDLLLLKQVCIFAKTELAEKLSKICARLVVNAMMNDAVIDVVTATQACQITSYTHIHKRCHKLCRYNSIKTTRIE